MWDNLGDLFHTALRTVIHEPPGRRASWRAIRGRFWLDYALWLGGVPEAEFERIYIERYRSASNLVAKWKSGATFPSRNSALALERILPGTLWLFDLPLFPLLADAPISRRTLESLTGGISWENIIGIPGWRLPLDEVNQRMNYTWYDSRELVERGDIWGLCALIASLRRAELIGDHYQHFQIGKDAFRALPELLRLPWAADSIESIYKQMERIRRRVQFNYRLFGVNWEAIKTLANTPGFYANPLLRPKDHDGNPLVFQDPIVALRVVKDRQQSTW